MREAGISHMVPSSWQYHEHEDYHRLEIHGFRAVEVDLESSTFQSIVFWACITLNRYESISIERRVSNKGELYATKKVRLQDCAKSSYRHIFARFNMAVSSKRSWTLPPYPSFPHRTRDCFFSSFYLFLEKPRSRKGRPIYLFVCLFDCFAKKAQSKYKYIYIYIHM